MNGRPGFGRRHAPDDRDRRHLMRAHPVLAEAPPPTRRWRRWWNRGARLRQGDTGTCVAHACVHLAENGPVTRPGTMDPYELYRQIVLLDEWTDNDSEAVGPIDEMQFGSSVRAGAKALKLKGIIGEYLWAWEIETLIDWILATGPVVIGVNWYTGMLDTDDKGIIRVTGKVEGGHATILDAVNLDTGMFRGLNSWGQDWGTRGGTFRLSFEDMDRLLREDGEALAAVEIKPTPARTFEEEQS